MCVCVCVCFTAFKVTYDKRCSIYLAKYLLQQCFIQDFLSGILIIFLGREGAEFVVPLA